MMYLIHGSPRQWLSAARDKMDSWLKVHIIYAFVLLDFGI